MSLQNTKRSIHTFSCSITCVAEGARDATCNVDKLICGQDDEVGYAYDQLASVSKARDGETCPDGWISTFPVIVVKNVVGSKVGNNQREYYLGVNKKTFVRPTSRQKWRFVSR